MNKWLVAISLLVPLSTVANAGPKEDAFLVLEQ